MMPTLWSLVALGGCHHDNLQCGRGWWGCEVSCGGHHWQRGKTTTGSALDGAAHEKKIVTVSSRWPWWSRLRAQWSRLGEVTARSQLNHGIFSMITARSQLNHGPGHGSVMAGCDHFGHHGELTVSSHGEQSRWPIFVSWEYLISLKYWPI